MINQKYLSVWYKYTSLKYNLFSKSKSNDPINLQSSDSIWLMQIYMWYFKSILADTRRLPLDPWPLLKYVDFRWPQDLVDLRPLTSPPLPVFNATSWLLTSWMTTSGNPRTQSWPLTSHHKTLLFQFLNKRKEIVLFRFSQRVMF